MGGSRAFSRHTKWSASEVAILVKHYPDAHYELLLKLLPGRSKSMIQNKANGLGIVRVKPLKRTVDETREAKRAYMARKRELDPEGVRAYQRRIHHKNAEANKAKMRAYASKRFFWVRAMHLRGENRATTSDISYLWKLQKGLCALTGRRLDRTAHLDHILPKARGGGDSISNLRWVCSEVNIAKRHLTDEEFAQLCTDCLRWIGKRIQMEANR